MSIKTVILQFICPDKPGLVSELASWIASKNGNIRHADHHTDAGANLFLSRIEWDLDGFLLDKNPDFDALKCIISLRIALFLEANSNSL